MTPDKILIKVKEMLEINTRVNWSDAIPPEEEFQNILDAIEKMEKEEK